MPLNGDHLTILGKNFNPGDSGQVYLEVAKLHTRTDIEVPIIIERAKKVGPVLLLMAAVHGDEVNGVEIIRRIIKKGFNKPERGTIICIPVFNIFGFLNLTREFPDGRDLNRMFPGSAKGSLASRFAHLFVKEIAPVIDCVIDFHTGGATRFNYPQVRCLFKKTKTFEMAKAFGAPFIINSNYREKSVRATLDQMGKTSLIFEGGRANSFDETVINQAIKGTLNVMSYLGLRPMKKKTKNQSIIINKSNWIRAPYSGMFNAGVLNGNKVRKQQVLGTITDPFGDFEKDVVSPYKGHIICVNTAPTVHRGDALFHVGQEK